MSCEHLVCANCAGPVVEGRCAVCRAARADVHSHLPFGLTPQLMAIVAIITVVAVALLAAAHGQ